MADDWDLHAVVRGCATTSSVKTSKKFSTFQQDCNFSNSCFQEPRRERIAQQELLHDLYKPFFPKSQDSSQLQFSTPPQTELRQSFSVSDVSKAHNPPPTPRSKRRKNHLKRVCHVAAENLSSDMWSWRKYGQKPIKGSPYPRGYYRCSTSKGCMARKQVERNRSDPGMFIVTYTAEHNHPMPTHRNSLAGSTRQKPTLDKPSPPPDDDDEDDSKMALEDDFFAGLEDFTATDCTSAHFPANLQFPWLSATTIAGGG